MKRGCLVALALVALLLIGPLLVPLPPLRDALPVEQLADPDSRFVEINRLRIHYKMFGQSEPALLLLHGFGASLFSWREVMAPLAESYTAIAFDRPAFGLTSRPMPGEWQGDNPYAPESQADLTVALMDALGIEKAVLVGNSAGGTIAVLTALRHPERVQALILVSAAVYSGGGTPPWLQPLLRTPQARRLGPLALRVFLSRGERLLDTAWHDPARITPEILEGYRKFAQVENWDRALWEFTLASHPLDLPAHLSEITVPVLAIAGDDDRIVPTDESIRLARELPEAELVIIPDCGHVPQEECPEPFLQAVISFLAR